VHHCAYPQADEAMVNDQLASDMDLVGDMVSAILSIRENKQLRVRQPLQRLIVDPVDENTVAVVKRFESHIKDELNIKEITAEPISKYQKVEVKPNNKTIGPKFGKDRNQVLQLLAEQAPAEIAASVAAGKEFTITGGDKSFTLQPEDVIIENLKVENMEFAISESFRVALDTAITPELLREGFARDVVRHIQQTRKDSGLEIQDHIHVQWHSSDETLQAAVREYSDYIRRETLADSLREEPAISGDSVKEIEIGKLILKIKLQKAV